MARQIGAIRITGTVGDLTCYKWDGLHCARAKSRLTGKQVKTQPRFRRTMELSCVIGEACVLATGARKFLENQSSLILPAGFSWRDLDYALQRSATQMLKEGLYSDEVFEALKQLPTAEWLEEALIRKMIKIQKPRKRKSVEFFHNVEYDDRLEGIPPSVLKKLSFRRITDPDFSMDAFLSKYAPATGKPKQKEIFATACRIGNAVYKQLAVKPANNTLRRKLIGDARRMLKEGLDENSITIELMHSNPLPQGGDTVQRKDLKIQYLPCRKNTSGRELFRIAKFALANSQHSLPVHSSIGTDIIAYPARRNHRRGRFRRRHDHALAPGCSQSPRGLLSPRGLSFEQYFRLPTSLQRTPWIHTSRVQSYCASCRHKKNTTKHEPYPPGRGWR